MTATQALPLKPNWDFFSSPSTVLMRETMASGITVAIAVAATCPFDVLKTRVVVAMKSGERPTLMQTASSMLRNEGLSSFAKGMGPSSFKGAVSGSIRLGFYAPIKKLLSKDGSANDLGVGKKLLAGSLSGGMAAFTTNPIELIKTKMHTAEVKGNSITIAREIMAKEGIKGLWKGATPAVMRQVTMTASQCVVYEEVKHKLLDMGLPNHDVTFAVAGAITGVASTTAMCPADVVKTLLYTGKYNSVLAAISDVYKTNGLGGFMRGWSLAYMRMGPQTLIMFMVAEHMRRLFGLSAL